ncbi:MAG: threonine-phosphate decarboxylase CobD [Magnetospirillum sp. WYHS-4]
MTGDPSPEAGLSSEPPGPAAAIDHGGDLAAATAAFGMPAEDWLDLSTGINPHSYLVLPPHPEAWSRLPDTGVTMRLLAAAARCYGVADPSLVVAAPGTQALIQWLPLLVGRTRVAVLSPTYAEHAGAWRAAGHTVVEVGGLAALKAAQPGVAVIVNPNNPDGRRVRPADILDLTEQMAERRGLVMVDEAFADTLPEISVAAQAGLPGLVVLRSFGKFFGLAGLRLGFALAWPDMAEALRSALGPWAVSGPAAAVATGALEDDTWIAITRQRLRLSMEQLHALLQRSGLEVLGGTSLFVLTAHDRAPDLHAHLARQGIWVRRFSDHPRWLRFGLPPEGSWERLEVGIKSFPG